MAIPFLGLAAHTTLGFRAQLVTARLSARVLRVARHQIKYPEGFNATVTRKDGLGGCAGNAGTALRWRAPGPSSCRRLLWRRCRRLPHLVYIPRTHFGLRRSDEHLPASVQGDCEVLYSVVASIPQNGSEKFPSHHCRFRRSLSKLPPLQPRLPRRWTTDRGFFQTGGDRRGRVQPWPWGRRRSRSVRGCGA